MRVDQIASFTTALSVTPPTTGGFSIPLLLVDTTDVTLYDRYIKTSRSSYQTDLTASSEQDLWCDDLWAQNYNPEFAYIGRWAKAATSSSFVLPDCAAFSATWTAVTAGDFGLSIGGVPTVLVTTGTMAGATSLADVAAIIQTAVQAEGGSYAACTVSIDANGYPVLANSTTGDSSAAIAFTAPTGGAGTDITGSSYLGVSTGFAVAGIDAEDPDDALAAIKALDDEPFVCCVRSTPSIAQMNSLGAALATYKMVGEFRVTDSDAKSSGATTDIGYLLEAAANNNTHLAYTEHTTQNPDAAIIGEVYPRPEGSTSLALTGIANCYQSGLHADGTTIIPLTDSERSTLEDKGYDYLVKPSSIVHFRHGLTPGGVEMRHRVAFYWLDKRMSQAAYAYMTANDVVTFSDKHITAIGGLFKTLADTLVKREAIEADYTMNLPLASSFSAATKATHTLSMPLMAEMLAQFAINDIAATMSATV